MSHKGVRVGHVGLLPTITLLILASVARSLAQADLYVANLGSDDVWVVDTATDQVKAKIPVGDDPDGIAVLPSGAAVYVANFLGDDVSVIDAATQAVTATIAVGSGPVGVAAAPDSQRVYVANRESNSVSVIDTRSLRVIANVQVGEGPNGIAARPDGGVVYVTNSFTHSPGVVSVIATATNAVVDSIAVNHSPGRVAFTPDGELAYVANYRSHNVSVIDARSHDVIATVPVAGRATNVAVAPNGELVYVTTLGGRINVIESGFNSLYANILVGVEPYAIAILPNAERAYTADLRSDTSSIVDTVNHEPDGQLAVGMQPFAVAIRCIAANCAAPPLTPRPTRTPTPSASTTSTARPSSTPRPTATQPTPTATAAPMVVRVGSGVPDSAGRVRIQVALEGENVGGFQNDITFDNTVLALEERDCTIEPAIGLFPLGSAGETNCLEDTTIGPCKTLNRVVDQCGSQPPAHGCEGAASNVSRLRVIIAATAAPNDHVIPPGIAYTCNFQVLRPETLPTTLNVSFVVGANPVGDRFPNAVGVDGVITAGDGSSSQPSSLSGDGGSGCAIAPGATSMAHWHLALLLLLLAVRQRAAETPARRRQ